MKDYLSIDELIGNGGIDGFDEKILLKDLSDLEDCAETAQEYVKMRRVGSFVGNAKFLLSIAILNRNREFFLDAKFEEMYESDTVETFRDVLDYANGVLKDPTDTNLITPEHALTSEDFTLALGRNVFFFRNVLEFTKYDRYSMYSQSVYERIKTCALSLAYSDTIQIRHLEFMTELIEGYIQANDSTWHQINDEVVGYFMASKDEYRIMIKFIQDVYIPEGGSFDKVIDKNDPKYIACKDRAICALGYIMGIHASENEIPCDKSWRRFCEKYNIEVH